MPASSNVMPPVVIAPVNSNFNDCSPIYASSVEKAIHEEKSWKKLSFVYASKPECSNKFSEDTFLNALSATVLCFFVPSALLYDTAEEPNTFPL